MKKVISIFGTRPEAIKMAPLVEKLLEDKNIDDKVVVTAQHREMLDQVLELFSITPDYDLNIMKKGQTLEGITTKALEGLSKIFAEEKPDLVLVHGDTTTTFVGALAAFYNQIPVGHVEAGLRTGNKYSPFPEEMNRKLTTSLADLHFAPTETSRDNLLKEGISADKIFVTGNTVIDALLETASKDFDLGSIPELAKIDFTKKVLLVTSHRRENLGKKMQNIFKALRDIAEEFKEEVEIVFPVHLNPKVRETVAEYLSGKSNVHLIEPLDYQPFVNVMKNSYLILTDSGGIQEEAPSLGKPVLVLRDTTERPEALKAGTVDLAGTSYEVVYKKTRELIINEEAYKKMAGAINPYGDGQAAIRIVKIINETT